MNSTDPADLEAMLGALFDQVLMPVSGRMHDAGEEAFPRKPDVSWLSYYVRRKRSSMTAADLGGIACVDGIEFAQRLEAHWRALGRTELAALAGHFGTVAEAARLARKASAPERAVSPYVYAMF